MSSLSRRALLRRGGLGAAGAALFGPGALARASSAEAQEDEGPRNAVLVILPLLRADYIGIYPGKSRADTPNLDRLAKKSVRFEHAIAESMPAWPVRRALMSGVRSFPFRNWRRTEGMPPVPGFNPIWDHQPLITETTAAAGIETVWISDNPLLEGPRYGAVKRTGADMARVDPPEPGLDSEFLPSLDRARDAAVRTLKAGTEELGRLSKAQPFFLAIDAFDPQDAYEPPLTYARPERIETFGLRAERLVPTRFDNDRADELGEHFADNVEKVDAGVGELLDRLEDLDLMDDTMIVLIGDHGVALGEHGFVGKAALTTHRLSHEIAFMIRHPDGEKAGDELAWYASTHDAPSTILGFLGVPIPGKMDGEDLTALFDGVDEEDLRHRPYFTSCRDTQMMVGNDRWLLLMDRAEQQRWLFDDEEDEDVRFEDVANEEPRALQELSMAAGIAAGGTVPEFGPDGALRPKPELRGNDKDGDGIPNDDDPVDDEAFGDDDINDDDSRAGAFDGKDPIGKRGDFFGGDDDQPPPAGQRGAYFSKPQP